MKTELTMDGGVLITGGATGIGFALARKFHLNSSH
jgi:short-subunit dehydrogenase involved in D-alanine esterification of teichoic acids